MKRLVLSKDFIQKKELSFVQKRVYYQCFYYKDVLPLYKYHIDDKQFIKFDLKNVEDEKMSKFNGLDEINLKELKEVCDYLINNYCLIKDDVTTLSDDVISGNELAIKLNEAHNVYKEVSKNFGVDSKEYKEAKDTYMALANDYQKQVRKDIKESNKTEEK